MFSRTECIYKCKYNQAAHIKHKVDVSTMDKLPTEMLLGIFQLLSYTDLKIVMLVCRRWRQIGEMPRLWSSLPVIVNKRNMSVMPEILSSGRFQSLDMLRIKSPLSEEVSKAILKHSGLREFQVSSGGKKTIISVLTVICSLEINDLYLKMDGIKMFGVSPELLAKAVTRLDGLDISDTRMTNKRAKAIFTAIIEGSNLTKLNIGFNNLSRVDPGLMAKVVTNLKILDVSGSELTQQQAVAILTSVSEGCSLDALNFFIMTLEV